MTKTSKLCIRFLESEVLTAVTMKIIVFWDVMPCCLVQIYSILFTSTPPPIFTSTQKFTAMRLKGLTAVTMKIMTLWNMIPCGLVEMYFSHF